MHQGLGGDHPIKQLAAGISGDFKDAPIGVGGGLVEKQHRKASKI